MVDVLKVTWESDTIKILALRARTQCTYLERCHPIRSGIPNGRVHFIISVSTSKRSISAELWSWKHALKRCSSLLVFVSKFLRWRHFTVSRRILGFPLNLDNQPRPASLSNVSFIILAMNLKRFLSGCSIFEGSEQTLTNLENSCDAFEEDGVVPVFERWCSSVDFCDGFSCTV